MESVVYIGAQEYNKVQAFAVQAKRITSHANHRFAKICKLHKLKASLHGKCRNLLLSKVTLDDGRPISPDDIPLARGMAVRLGMKFPYPSGTKWRMFTGIKTKYLNPTNVVKSEHRLFGATIAQWKSEIRPQKPCNRMHFAKANDVALSFAMVCNKCVGNGMMRAKILQERSVNSWRIRYSTFPLLNHFSYADVLNDRFSCPLR